MRTSQIVAIALLGAGVTVAGPVAAADNDDTAGTAAPTPSSDDPTGTRATGSASTGTTATGGRGNGQPANTPMAMQGVIDRVEQAGYRDVREVERKDGGRWEVYATDQQGRRVELYVDGRSGAIRRDD